jgi:hypothetical protein
MTQPAGKQVEVRSRFSGRWVSGFEVAEALQHDRYLLRRRSDGAVLPVPFPAREVRPQAE